MTQLPTIYFIHASDAPQHEGNFTSIVQRLKTENRIGGFVAIGPGELSDNLNDQVRDSDLVVTLLTSEFEPAKKETDQKLSALKIRHPGIKVAEIIVDNVPYENEFITFPVDLKPIRSRKDMDAVWGDIEQSFRDMFPVQEPEPARQAAHWPKYLKMAGLVIVLALVFFLVKWLIGDNTGERAVKVPAAEATPVSTQEDKPTLGDCFVETSLLTQAHLKPDPFSTTRGTFPRNKKYNVIDTEVFNHGNVAEIYFFLIEDQEKGLKGWVSSRSLDFFSKECIHE